jgi:GAF domain-containing protein/ketosteroid isomerase-like protein
MPAGLGELCTRYHRAFNERDFDVWREVFDEDVELLIDGMSFRGVDAAVAYGVGSVSRFPSLFIASERIVAESEDTIVMEIHLVNRDPAGGDPLDQGTACEIARVRDGRIVSCRSYYMPEPGGREDAVRVPARAEATVVAEEQAALRRVATLVARGVSQDELFATVNQEIARLVGADATSLTRVEPDDTLTLVAAWSSRRADLPVGSSRPMVEELRSMRETGRPRRWAPSELPAGPFVDEARALGIRASVGVPIVVGGRTWGFAFASSTAERPIPDDAEVRIAGFTELVATALANVQAREDLSAIVQEQAALRRVATLFARATRPEGVFATVAEEVGRVLSADVTGISRYDPDGTAAAVGGWAASGEGAAFPLPTRVRLGGRNVVTLVFETGRPARIDGIADSSGEPAAFARGRDFGSVVGAPISVEGRLWGVVMVISKSPHPLPPDTEERLAGFTELVATAIANAQARTELRRFADEQAALRRLATLVAGGTPPEKMFAAVTEEVAHALGTDQAGMTRFDSEHSVTLVAGWNTPTVPFGTRWAIDETNVHSQVLKTGRPARIDSLADSRVSADVGRVLGARSAVVVPITVEGRIWGLVFVTYTRDAPLPPDTEERLAGFTELVGTAISNAQARSELRGFADEQAALRRVATLVARGAPPEEVVGAVTEVIGHVLEADQAGMTRFESDGSVTLLATWNIVDVPVGARWSVGGLNVHTQVVETGRPARIDLYDAASGESADVGRTMGARSAVGVPIRVEGRLWGLVFVTSTRDEPLPTNTEARLAGFTELIATAIANAQARVELRGFADEQAALRRVATLVARGTPPEELLTAVAQEVGQLLRADFAVLSRYDADGFDTVIGGWARFDPGRPLPIGMRVIREGRNVHSLVFETQRPARVDAYDSASGAFAQVAREWGFRSSVGAPISVEGRLWGVMIVGSRTETLPADTQARLTGFTELAATAIANAQAQAALTASRARIVAAADTTRRRIERNLHDGAQQRLVSLALQLQNAQAVVPPAARELAEQLNRVASGVAGVLDELREIARGIHPAVLARGGLGMALKTLARRSSVPVRLDLQAKGRFPEPIETAAYYVVSETLTNAAKHASASAVDVGVDVDAGSLRICVRDDGRGGADLSRGTGLVGLQDRVEALGGRLSVHSPPGAGTTVRISLPLTTPAGLGSSPGASA